MVDNQVQKHFLVVPNGRAAPSEPFLCCPQWSNIRFANPSTFIQQSPGREDTKKIIFKPSCLRVFAVFVPQKPSNLHPATPLHRHHAPFVAGLLGGKHHQVRLQRLVGAGKNLARVVLRQRGHETAHHALVAAAVTG